MPDAFDQIVSEAIDNGHTGQPPPRQAARRASAPSRVPMDLDQIAAEADTDTAGIRPTPPRPRKQSDEVEVTWPLVVSFACYALAVVWLLGGFVGAVHWFSQGIEEAAIAAVIGGATLAVLLAAMAAIVSLAEKISGHNKH